MANLEYFYEQKDDPWTECPASISGAYMDNFKNLYDLCINNSLTDPKDLATGGHDAETDQKATMDFMVWLVSDPDASAKMVAELGILPYKNAPRLRTASWPTPPSTPPTTAT